MLEALLLCLLTWALAKIARNNGRSAWWCALMPPLYSAGRLGGELLGNELRLPESAADLVLWVGAITGAMTAWGIVVVVGSPRGFVRAGKADPIDPGQTFAPADAGPVKLRADDADNPYRAPRDG